MQRFKRVAATLHILETHTWLDLSVTGASLSALLVLISLEIFIVTLVCGGMDHQLPALGCFLRSGTLTTKINVGIFDSGQVGLTLKLELVVDEFFLLLYELLPLFVSLTRTLVISATHQAFL